MPGVRVRPEDAEELTKPQTARRLGVGVRQLENYLADGMPHRKDGTAVRIAWRNALEWFVARREEQAARRGGSSDAEDAKGRRELAGARMAELELAKLEGTLLEREEAERWVGDLFRRLATRAQAMTGKYTPRCVGLATPSAARKVLEGMVAEVLAAWQETALAAIDEDAA